LSGWVIGSVVSGASGGIGTSALVLDAVAELELELGVLEAVLLLLLLLVEPHAASRIVAASPATTTRGIAS